MTKLTTIDGKLRRYTSSASYKLVLTEEDDTGCCCAPCLYAYSIEMCNSNGVTDDDWSVKLNGTNIGTHSAPCCDPNAEDFDWLVGRKVTTFRTDVGVPGAWSAEAGSDGLGTCGEITYFLFDKNLFSPCGTNTLLLTVISNNGFENYGEMRVYRWKFDWEQNKYIIDQYLLAGWYSTEDSGASTVGKTNTESFLSPPCGDVGCPSLYSTGGDWSTPATWYCDEDLEFQSDAAPTSCQDVYILSGTMTGSGVCKNMYVS